jgi:anti-sigma B factor antagonist
VGSARFEPELGQPFAIKTIDADRLTTVFVLGELDMICTPDLEQALSTAKGDVLVDLSETSFIDSSGLHVLLTARARVADAGRRLLLACPPNGPAARLLRAVRLDGALDVYSTRSAAEAALDGTPG